MDTTEVTSTTTGRWRVVGIFDDIGGAERALSDLRDSGFSPENVSVVARDTRAAQELAERTAMEGAAQGAGAGAVIGGVGGGVLGWLVGVGALAIPGIGPIIAAGALATALAGAATGAVAGGLIGALVGLGIPENDARSYEEYVRGGSVLLSVGALSDQETTQAREIFDRNGGSAVRAYAMVDSTSSG